MALKVARADAKVFLYLVWPNLASNIFHTSSECPTRRGMWILNMIRKSVKIHIRILRTTYKYTYIQSANTNTNNMYRTTYKYTQYTHDVGTVYKCDEKQHIKTIKTWFQLIYKVKVLIKMIRFTKPTTYNIIEMKRDLAIATDSFFFFFCRSEVIQRSSYLRMANERKNTAKVVTSSLWSPIWPVSSKRTNFKESFT